MNEHASPRTWMITGSSSGFGLALARAALAAGDHVVATARHPDTLDGLIREAPDRAIAVRLDVTDPQQIADAVSEAFARAGRIDVLVNNAGYGSVGAVEEIDIHELEALHETMFLGPVRLTQAVLPAMRERGTGTIVQISSMGGQLAHPGSAPIAQPSSHSRPSPSPSPQRWPRSVSACSSSSPAPSGLSSAAAGCTVPAV
jgi:NADP-dependent 3-hydroxy acid dehydrogenase YdfG